MIAICLALKSSGHDAMLLGPPEKASWAASLGCPYQGFGADVSAFIDGFQNAENFRAGLAFISFVRKQLALQFRWLPDIIRKADLLDQFNITFLINQYRKKQGLEPVSYAWDHILGKNTIVAADKEIAGMPGDVKQTWIQTGYPHLEPAPEQVPALDRFLEKGTKPVYAGFGSMPVKDQIRIIPILIKAARHLGRRIILPCLHGLSTENTAGEDVFFIRDYPHLQLFPRLDAVIHHGGAGTTATAGVSGVPQVIVPHILDQYYHGRRIFLSHIGPEPIPRALLTESRLTAALEQCLFDPVIRQAAGKTGQSINPQKSLGRIVEAILS